MLGFLRLLRVAHVAQVDSCSILAVLSFPAAWLDPSKWAVLRDAGSSSLGLHIVRASVYLDVNQIVMSVTSCPCVVCVRVWLEEVGPVEIGAPQIVLHYKAAIDVRGDIMQPHPARQDW